ncbi:amine oxidase [Spirochaetia bacterium]|nr:amine oxidase [Spirochaetia bacterium]
MKKIAIIGAGVSGMTAAIYCLKSGFSVTVYEKHTISGGACTSWKRGGYTFEGSVHWLSDSGESSSLYKLWRDTDILAEGVKTWRNDPYFVYEHEGAEVRLYRDLKKLKAHFLEISPEDKKAINTLYNDVHALLYLQVPIMDIWGLKTKKMNRPKVSMLLKMLPCLFKLRRFSKFSATEYAAAFKHPGIRKALGEFIVNSEYGCLALLMTMATFMDSGVFPDGGSSALAKRMENKIKTLGGKIIFNTKAGKVIVENGHAKGVEINGEKILYDGVIVTQDTIAAQSLFDQPPEDKWLRNLKHAKPIQCTFAGIGVKADLSDMPYSFAINENISAGGILYDSPGFNNYASHPEYAPAGCTTLTTLLTGDSYDFWKAHRQNGSYDEQKKILADELTRLIEKSLPRLKGKIEVIDIATPLTYERYTGSYRGAWMTVLDKGDRYVMPAPISREIKNLYFAGFRTIAPGGLPVALLSGFRAAQYACRDNGMVFEGANQG